MKVFMYLCCERRREAWHGGDLCACRSAQSAHTSKAFQQCPLPDRANAGNIGQLARERAPGSEVAIEGVREAMRFIAHALQQS
jgi:hypothetical protein